MLKKVLMGAVTALSLGVMISLNAGTTEAASNIKIDEAGNVLLLADNEETDGATAVQLSLKVDSEIDADISFEFNSENDIKISEYRYHADTNCLNIYMADSKPLFDGEEPLDNGAVSAMDIDGNTVDVQIEVVENSLKYVYQNTLMEDEFEVEIATKPTTTSTTTSTTTTTTSTTTTTKPTTTTTTSTTTTTKPTTTTTTSTTTTTKPTTTTTTTSTTTTTKPTTTTTTSTTTTTKPTTTTTTSTTTTTKPTTTTTTSTTTTTKPTTTTTTSTTTTTKPITTTPPTTTAVNNGHIASDEELCNWSIKNYQDTTGITVAKAEINENSDGLYEITMSDDSGAVLDTYTIDPDTGIGTNSANEEINLPQTGNNAMKKILIALGALMLIGFGLYIIKISGVIRFRKYEK